MKHRFFLFAVFAVAFFLSRSITAQWVRTNEPFGGLVSSFATDGTNLFAGTSGGVFLSTNNGESWKVVNAGLPKYPYNDDVFAIAISGINLFAGIYGNGVFLSTDNGKNWTGTGTGSTGSYVQAFGVNGSNLFVSTTDSGVFRTSDNGTSWKAVNTGLPGLWVMAFAVSDTNLFAGTWGGGVYLSTNNGVNWKGVNNGLGGIVFSLAVNGTNLFAGIDGGVVLSTDNGANWIAAGSDWAGIQVRSFAFSGTNLFAGTESAEVFLSTNNGTNWQAVSTGLPNNAVRSLAVSGTNLFAGTGSSGIWKRPLSEMISANAVEDLPKTKSSIESFPNPFSQSTSIKFSSDKPGFTQVSIHKLLGTEVARLFMGELDAGEHSLTWDARGMPQGMYICIIRASGRTEELPVMLVK